MKQLEQQVLLISGTGGAYTIRGKDLENSLFDPGIRAKLITDAYTVDGVPIIPENASFVDSGRVVPLLRRNQSGYPPLVTRTLEDILDKNDISYLSIPCDTIWEDREFEACSVPFVCLSTTFMWSERMIQRALEWVSDKVQFRYLIIGGHYSSIKYRLMLSQYPQISYIIIGDGETALPALIHHLEKPESGDLKQIPNLAFLKDGKLVLTQQKYEDISKLPKVQYKGKYDRLSYESVRGCAFGCKFCTWDAGIKRFRYKPVEQILQDVKEYMTENQIKRIEINDSTFLFPFSRIEGIVDGFSKMGIHWKAHCRADVPWTDELIEKLNHSNCDILQIGFESMNDRILKNMNKKTTAAMNRFTNEALSHTRIDTVVSFIIGFPDESPAEFQDTWDYLLKDFQGHFYLFVFEMEDKSLELYAERDKYGFELYEDDEDCLHGGSHWKHNGMTSEQAFQIRGEVLRSVRRANARAIYKSWQSPYEWPFITNQTREQNLKIERLVDNLVFLPQDVPSSEIHSAVVAIRDELKGLGISFGGLQ